MKGGARMKYRLVAVSTVMTVVVVTSSALVLVAGSSQAQTTAVNTSNTWTPPRTLWDDPDLQGIWTSMQEAGTPFERPAELAQRGITDPQNPEALRMQQVIDADAQTRQQSEKRLDEAGGLGTGAGPVHWYENLDPQKSHLWFVVDPPDGTVPPLTPEAKKRAAAKAAARQGLGNDEPRPGHWVEDFSTFVRCITRGLPAVYLPLAYNQNFQIVQSPGYVTILYEMMHETRVIPLDGDPHLAPHVRQWTGDPRGRWEGNTLVVETTNFSNKTNYVGGHTSDAIMLAGEEGDEHLRLVERFTRVGPNTIDWSVTVDKPSTWTRPWTFAIPLTRDAGQDWIFEYACHEANYGIAHILSGARATERAAQEAGRDTTGR